MSSRFRTGLWLAALMLAGGCGGDSNTGADADASANADVDAGVADGGQDPADSATTSEQPLLPWEVGNTWTYQVTNNGEVITKVTTIEEMEPVGGTGPNKDVVAFRVRTKKGPLDETVSWQGVDGDRVVRYREQSFHANTGELELEEHWEPHKLHVDGSSEHTAKGGDWLEEYKETKIPAGGIASSETKRDRWTVDGVDVEVTVPAGTFRALVLRKAGGSTLKTYWYVPGIGKVKETGGQTEELVSYEVAP